MNSALVVHRPIESALFGHAIFSANVSSVADVERMLAGVPAHDVGLVVVRVPADALAAAQRLEAAGGRLCDILVTMTGHVSPLSNAPHTVPAGIAIRRGDALDAALLHDLAARAFSGFVGHWHADTRLPGHLSDTLYARWAADLAKGAGAERPLYLAVAGEHRIAAFLALARDESERWHVPLTAVDPEFRGHGLLQSLLVAGTRELPAGSDTVLDYETQLTNRAALRTVSRCGLIPSTARLTFHLWTPLQ